MARGTGGGAIRRVPTFSFIIVVGLIAILSMAIFGPFVLMGFNAIRRTLGFPVRNGA